MTELHLSIYLILYCLLHSLLAEKKLMGRLYDSWWFRFFYVCQSLILLIPVGLIYAGINHKPFFTPMFISRIILWMITFYGIGFGIIAAKSYDNMFFLGISQIKAHLRGEKLPVQPKKLKTDGALAVVRHPYYTAALLIIWSRPMNRTDLIINLILTAYFILGYKNEERKLIEEFGQEYVDYQKRVPALIPRFGSKNAK